MDTKHWVHDARTYGPVSYTGLFIQDGPMGETEFPITN